MQPYLGKSDTNIDVEIGYKMLKIRNADLATMPHYHDYFEFFLTMSDGIVHVINGEQQTLPAKSLVFIRPNDVHCYKRGGENLSFLNFALSADPVVQLCTYYGSVADNMLAQTMPPVIQLSEQEYEHLLQRFNSLNAIDPQNRQQQRIQMKMLLSELLLQFIGDAVEIKDNSIPLWLTALLNRTKDVEYLGMTLDDMAQLTGMSREHISRSFRKHLHTTASRYMLDQKLNYSANLLLNTNLSVLDVCYESHFESPCWFYQKFKEKFGVTPKEYRNRAASL